MKPEPVTQWHPARNVGDPPTVPDAEPSSIDRGGVDQLRFEITEDMRSNRELREKYASKAYGLATGCLALWTICVAAQGVVNAISGIEMWSDQVLIAVTTGVTVSVLAAFLGVIRGLFPGKGKDAEAAKAAA